MDILHSIVTKRDGWTKAGSNSRPHLLQRGLPWFQIFLNPRLTYKEKGHFNIMERPGLSIAQWASILLRIVSSLLSGELIPGGFGDTGLMGWRERKPWSPSALGCPSCGPWSGGSRRGWMGEGEGVGGGGCCGGGGRGGEASSSGLPPHQGIPLTLPLRHLYLTCVTFLWNIWEWVVSDNLSHSLIGWPAADFNKRRLFSPKK